MKKIKCQLKLTDDGSHTLYVPDLDEHYHSTFGAIQEAMHIYIKAGFRYSNKNPVNILEIGFGTGLNAYLTLIEAEKMQKDVHYHSIELYPVQKEYLKKLNYTEQINYPDKKLFYKIHNAAWNTKQKITQKFHLYKIQADICNYTLKNKYDVVYFDAFAPNVQPELWTTEIFQKIYNHLNNNAILTTYSTKGTVKQALRASGFKIKRLPGPPGKREILRAARINNFKFPKKP